MEGTPRHNRAYTTIEMMIAIAILAIISLASLNLMVSGDRLTQQAVVSGHLRERARIFVERLAREIRYSGTTCPDFDMATDANLTSFSFRRATGYNVTLELPEWGDLIRYELRAIPGSGEEYTPGIGVNYADGIDNDNNDIIDEGGVYRLVNGAEARLIVRDVVASEFWVRRLDNTVTIRVGLAMPDPSVRGGGLLTGTYETMVVLRN